MTQALKARRAHRAESLDRPRIEHAHATGWANARRRAPRPLLLRGQSLETLEEIKTFVKEEIRNKMVAELRCLAEGLPSDTDVTEGFGVGNGANNALNRDIFDMNVNEPPAVAATTP